MKNLKLFFVISILLMACKKETIEVEKPIRTADYIGTYEVIDDCANGELIQTDRYEISITQLGERLKISNLWNYDITVLADVKENLITIPTQTVKDIDGDNVTIKGTGTSQKALVLKLEYNLDWADYPDFSQYCTITCIKK